MSYIGYIPSQGGMASLPPAVFVHRPIGLRVRFDSRGRRGFLSETEHEQTT